jgi:hypothetical protein
VRLLLPVGGASVAAQERGKAPLNLFQRFQQVMRTFC